MTEKHRFMQHTVPLLIASHPEHPNIADAIRWSEKIWRGLLNAGYTQNANKEHKPRESKNWYKALSEHQKKHFCLFWNAFAYKQGRNEAAMAWYQLGELSEGDYKTIIEAAKKEAQRQLPKGQVRKMAQGWLTQMRWLDSAPASTEDSEDIGRKEHIRELMGEMQHAENMLKMAPSTHWESVKHKALQELQDMGVTT